MYHRIVERKLRSSFEQVNVGNLRAVVGQFAPDAEHWFSGSHALSGRRTNLDEIQSWYDRLAVVLPDLHFDIVAVTVRGLPWNTIAMVEWVDRFTDPQGRRYSNQGVHVVGIKWGKLTSLHIYCDTQLLATACAAIAEQQVVEAGAPPIGEQTPFGAAQALTHTV